MKKWYMIIDIEKCEDCNNCMLACKDEHVDNDWPGYTAPQPRHGNRWIDIARKERGVFPYVDAAYRPTPCMHCENAPCIAAGDGAVYKRTDGIVIIDPLKAKGKKELLGSCPYNAIHWNDDLGVPQKCTFCAHLLDEGWEVPRCVHSCPTGALRMEYADDDEMNGIVSEEGLEYLFGGLNTSPKVYYKNMYRFDRCFIAGSIDETKDGITDCVEGAKVSLYKDGKLMAETTTDTYGDFKFDGLDDSGEQYSIEVDYKSYDKKTLEARVGTSININF